MFALLKAHHFDLIVLDFGLPDSDGLTLAQHLRSISQIPIIAVTSRKSSNDKVMALGIGINDYLAKPFDPRELSLRIKNILQKAGPTNTPPTPPQPMSVPQPAPMSRNRRLRESRDLGSNPDDRAKYSIRRIRYILFGIIAVVISVATTAVIMAPEPESQLAGQKSDETFTPMPRTNALPMEEEVGVEEVATLTSQSPKAPDTLETPPTPSLPVVPARTSRPADDLSWVAQSSCDKFPKVDWWRFKTHIGVVSYVQRKFGGDFSSYYKTWDVRLKRLVDINARESGALTRTKVVLRGEDLTNYIAQIKMRLEIIQCLSQAAVNADPANYKPAN